MTLQEINNQAAVFYPNLGPVELRERKAFVKGCMFALQNKPEAPMDFFMQLAEGLRKLWPPGEKDGKWSWRESTSNLERRLKLLWDIRQLKAYSLDECLTVARKYVAQFEDNAKYMKILKYFVLRQNEKVIGKDGRIHYINQSTFADMLEGASMLELQDDLESSFETNNIVEQGEII